jgi:subfamily B ATP-binding cassette protein HlyB/CyaB
MMANPSREPYMSVVWKTYRDGPDEGAWEPAAYNVHTEDGQEYGRWRRVFVPETGRVLVDGVDLAMVDPAWLRRQIGIVLQENVLFNRTVRDNIALADPGMPMERVIAAADLAGAHDFILELPEGYDTIVGERGATLSGGQRQRIAIARALVGDPRILIFDEATSQLDSESERIIQHNMERIARGRTVIIIAQRRRP